MRRTETLSNRHENSFTAWRRPAAAIVVGFATLLCASCSEQETPPPKVLNTRPVADAKQSMSRPSDFERWVELGTTVHMAATGPEVPAEFRDVRMEPEAYKALLRDGHFPDGAKLAVTFRAPRVEPGESPKLVAEGRETFFAVEVIDRTVADGRRFYLFSEGVAAVAPLPQGNACANCHEAQGTFEGTFAHLYPPIADFAGPPKRVAANAPPSEMKTHP